MAAIEEDAVKGAIEAGKEEEIVRLREQGYPIRHEHLALIRSIPKIRDALSSLSGNTRKMRRAFEGVFCKVLLVQRSFNHLLHVNAHGYSALNELARKNDWDLIIELIDYFDPMSIDMDQLDTMGESFAQLATSAPQQVKDRIAKYRYYCGLRHNSIFSFSNVIIEDLSNGCERFPVRVINDMDKTRLSAFKYVNRIIDEHGLLNLPEDELAKCSCSSNISCIEIDSCDCCASGNRYNSKGYLIADPQNEFSSIMECTKLCGCSMLCGNRVAQKGATFPIEIFRTTAKGWGVRSRVDIPLGAFIGEYTGLILPESLANGDRDDSYVFETKWLDDQPVCIDGKPAGNFTRFINHSCNPNAKVFNVNWDHKKSQLYHVCIYADRFIVKGEEITINYGSLWWKSKNEVICKCDYENCLYREVRTEQTEQTQERAVTQTEQSQQQADQTVQGLSQLETAQSL